VIHNGSGAAAFVLAGGVGLNGGKDRLRGRLPAQAAIAGPSRDCRPKPRLPANA